MSLRIFTVGIHACDRCGREQTTDLLPSSRGTGMTQEEIVLHGATFDREVCGPCGAVLDRDNALLSTAPERAPVPLPKYTDQPYHLSDEQIAHEMDRHADEPREYAHQQPQHVCF